MSNKLIESEHWNPYLNIVIGRLFTVFEIGAKKHGLHSWLDDTNPSLEHKANCASMFRHLSEHYVQPEELDSDSGLPHGYHLLCRMLMRLAKDEEVKYTNDKGLI